MPTLSAIIHKDEDMYVSQCPEVGTFSQGKSIEEAALNLREATELYLEEFPLSKIYISVAVTEKKRPFIIPTS